MSGNWICKSNEEGATVVFVHGILSSGESCWKHPNGTYWPELIKNEPGFESLGIYFIPIIQVLTAVPIT